MLEAEGKADGKAAGKDSLFAKYMSELKNNKKLLEVGN